MLFTCVDSIGVYVVYKINENLILLSIEPTSFTKTFEINVVNYNFELKIFKKHYPHTKQYLD